MSSPPTESPLRDRLAVGLLVALTLTACAGYPDEFPSLDRGVFGPFTTGCANIAGTYRLDGVESRRNRSVFQESLLWDVIGEADARWPWEQITISGDARDSLVVTASRSDSAAMAYRDFAAAHGDPAHSQWSRLQSPAVRWSGAFARMSDAEYAANLDKLTMHRQRRRVMRRGVEYECGRGWVRGVRTVHEPGPDSRAPRPDTTNGEVLLGRGTDGSLLAKAVFRESQEFSVWCGDGCRGVPLGTWTVTHWARLGTDEPRAHTPDPRPWAVRWTVPDAATPTVTATSQPAHSSRRETQVREEELTAHVRAKVTDGVVITATQADQQLLNVTLRFATPARVSDFLRALADDPLLSPPELVEVRADTGPGGIAVVRVRRR